MKSLSPYHQIKAGIGPSIIFHGTADTTVPFRTAEIFHQAANAKDSSCTMVAYTGEGHGFFNYGRKNNRPFVDTMQKLDAFLVGLGYLEEVASHKVY